MCQYANKKNIDNVFFKFLPTNLLFFYKPKKTLYF